MSELKVIWTIGHSTRPFEEFIRLLQAHGIQQLVDVRSFPGSRRYPQYNTENLTVSLPGRQIFYRHMPGLGGRRKPREDSVNKAWRHPAFRGYADYMQTDAFIEEAKNLESLALKGRTAYMCSEAVWWRCHRALISDYLKNRGWQVWHIMEEGKAMEHPFTSPARSEQGKLFYDD